MTYLQKSVGGSIDEAFSAIQHSMNRGVKKLLIVGQGALRDNLESVIGGEDIEIITASSGEEALSVLERDRAHAIVLDGHLQDMGVLHFVREAHKTAKRPIVLFDEKPNNADELHMA